MKSKDERGKEFFPESFSAPFYFHFRGDCNLPLSEPNLDGFYDARYDRFYDSASGDEQAKVVGVQESVL